MDSISVARLQLVVPQLSDKVYQLDTRLRLKGVVIRVTFGMRSSSEQKAEWMQGRFSLDEVNAQRKIVGMAPIIEAENHKVTNAPPGYSWHEYGMAVDVVPLLTTQLPDWNVAHPDWQLIVTTGESLGLTSGISWHDEPHLQLTGKFPVAAPNDECRTLIAQGGLESVWEAAFS